MKKKIIAISLMTVAGVAFIDDEESLNTSHLFWEQEENTDVLMHEEEEQEIDY